MRKGTHYTEKSKRLLSKAHKGRVSPNKGKHVNHSGCFKKGNTCAKGRTPWNKGLTKKTDKRIAKWAKTREGQPSKLKGIVLSEEHKRKVSKTLKGRRLSEEHRENISKGQKGNKNHMYGKHHSEETKNKISKACIGRFLGVALSEEHKRKVSKALMGHPSTNYGGYRGKERHQNLVKKMTSWLDNGKNKIEVEKPVKVNSNRWRIIDILVNNNICIEIGRCSKEKIDDLKNNNFTVIHLPYTIFR